MREALQDLRQRYEERTWVDRAKGVLMSAWQLPEDEAFRLLRSASMRSQRRVGEVARRVVGAAHDAVAVNRAGQLRMLSQRAVKLVALLAVQAAPLPNGHGSTARSRASTRTSPGSSRASSASATATCSMPWSPPGRC